MYRRRSYRRRYKVAKYSSENYSNFGIFNYNDISPNDGTSAGSIKKSYYGPPPLAIISSTNISGMRKVKNFTIELNPAFQAATTAQGSLDPINVPYVWALIYVPEGQDPSPNFANSGVGGGSLYEPNQNVIISGTGLTNTPLPRKVTRLARNLNSGDRIYFVMRLSVEPYNIAASRLTISLGANYAICYS